jgi:hypothetical protein
MMYKIFILAFLFLLAPGCSHGEQNENVLQITRENWDQVLFIDEDLPVSQSDAASFIIENDPQYGPCLVVGPWRAGKWSARFQFSQKLHLNRAIIRGKYRTINIKPFEACVSISYYQSDKRIAKYDFDLSPAENWTSFEVFVRHSPTGTDAISPGFGLMQKTEGQVFFTNITIDTDVTPLSLPDEMPPVTRVKPTKYFNKGEFFRIESDSNKTWWLVTPNGEPFYSIGIAGPSLENIEKGRRYIKLLNGIGFNSIARWSELESWAQLNSLLEKKGKAPLPVFFVIESNNLTGDFDYLNDAKGETCGDDEHEFPDPFDPRFLDAYRKYVAQVAKIIRGEKWFIGWFADNERDHTDLCRCVYSKYTNAEFISWLRNRYPSITDLNEAWGTTFSSIEDLLSVRPTPSIRYGRMYDDFSQFEKVIIKRYIDLTLNIIREKDPDHLVFSNRFMRSDSSYWFPLLDQYSVFDGIAINLYPSNQSAGLSESEKLLLQRVFEKTGKPLIIGEWSIPALDSGLYDDLNNLDWSFREVVAAQTERSRQAALVTEEFYNQPFILGAHWFRWEDYDSEQRRANRGIVKVNGEDWVELQQALKRAHKKLR